MHNTWQMEKWWYYILWIDSKKKCINELMLKNSIYYLVIIKNFKDNLWLNWSLTLKILVLYKLCYRKRVVIVMIMEKLQKLGRALMVPVAVLPAAAILMGIGIGLILQDGELIVQ